MNSDAPHSSCPLDPSDATRAASRPWWRREFRLSDVVPGLRRRPKLVGLLVVYLIYFILLDAPLWRWGGPIKDATMPVGAGATLGTWFGNRIITSQFNHNVAEAQAWWRGTFDLPRREVDTALIDGRVVNAYPPMMTLISACIIPFCPDGVPHFVFAIICGLTIPGLAYALMLRRTARVRTAVVLTLALVCGTSVLPVIRWALRSCLVYQVNHTLAVIGQLIMLIECFGRRRVWVMGIGLLVTAWSRQLTWFYAVPLIWAALNPVGLEGRPWRERWQRGRVVAAMAAVGVMVALPAALNTAKFHRPWEFGYRYIYVGIESEQADCARIGIFSPAFIPRNAYALNLGFPSLKQESHRTRIMPDYEGTGIWWTSPLLLWLIPAWRRVWTASGSRAWFGGAVLVMLGLLMYHTTGYFHHGYHRFSTDFVPVLFALLAPVWDASRLKWLVVAATAVGVAWYVLMT